MALHCPECGFVNADGANYCQKCGAYLGAREERAGEPSTATYKIDETGELVPVDVEEVVAHEGAALVIRAGGGRVGESFALDHDRMTIGRRPDSDVFLDDVTVSRDHALLGLETLAAVLLYIGVAMTLVATVMYVLAARPSTSA